MFINLTGFLKEDHLDNSLKYDFDIPSVHEKEVMKLLGWQSLEAESDGELPLTDEQAEKIFSLLGNQKPEGLDFFVGVSQ
ncbi:MULTISPECIES: pyocin S6 family toxin immunity protein [Pseudomonas]|uniref:Pyocin S6 family toxin immunity protein n=1 Tax=Pseudomonas peradeniyensis TaxID=2745488 RepID=A0ABT2VBF6_9PSED|nr:pyocin S6 family toxin immunity protein [Pseudomonas peradeniyensis]MCU7238893.1 pyocin S6 family toxin immunity protein [Pseudomonas peradeniyensis]MCU7281659.1 pyocin S6 family toxin immunity protein [Pseudomonas peradeniyensis]